MILYYNNRSGFFIEYYKNQRKAKGNKMSAICGIVDFGRGSVSPDMLRDMARAMILRGREQSGAYVVRGVGLAHDRMILSGGAHERQPYTVRRGGRDYTIVFDGELNNIGDIADIFEIGAFSSSAEAALECYIAFGYECVQYLEGSFAFAVYDESGGEIFLARDKRGGKPLYYAADGENLIFSSEIKGILRCFPEGAEVSARAVRKILEGNVGEVRGGDLYLGISELPAGSFALHSRLGTQVWSYRRRTDGDSSFSARRGEVITPDIDVTDTPIEPLLCEILTAFDYPCFDEYMLGFLTSLKAHRGARSVTVADRSLAFGESYSLERADRLGMMNAMMVNVVSHEDDKRVKNSVFSRLEKRLKEIAAERLGGGACRTNEIFGEDILSFAERQKETRARVRIYGAALQTEYWLASYPIIIK